MRIYAGPDITGDNAAHKLSDVLGSDPNVRAIYLTSTGGTGGASAGGSNVDATHGVHIPNIGVASVLAIAANPTDPSSPAAGFQLSDTYVYVPTGTTVQWSYVA